MSVSKIFSSPVIKFDNVKNINGYVSRPVEKIVEPQQDMLLIRRKFNQERLNKYRSDIPFQGIFEVRSHAWLQSCLPKGTTSPWKIHLYATTPQEQTKILNAVGPYLDDMGVMWKTAADSNVLQELNMTQQRGKAFTIYPRSNRDFERIARDVDYIIRANNLQTSKSSIQGDNQLGSTGRIFYRYECNSRRFKDCLFKANGEAYHKYHENNRGGNRYLASDMTVQDDPWFNYNPAGPYRIYPDCVDGKLVKELLSDNTEQSLFKLEQNTYYPLKNVSRIFLDKDCSISLAHPEVQKRILSLRDNSALYIGRSDDCQIRISPKHERVSRHHVKIYRMANEFYIQDTSKNGTCIQKNNWCLK